MNLLDQSCFNMNNMLFHIFVVLFLTCCSAAVEWLNLTEGSPCMRNNVTGKCVSIYNCLSSYVDYENHNHAPICSLKGKEPILCCTDCTFEDTRKMVIDRYVGILHKTGNKVRDKCIEYIHKLQYPCKVWHNATILRRYKNESNCHEVSVKVKSDPLVRRGHGGRNALRGEFPHMALLGYGDADETAQWLCGGSVISERFILTAGHCLSSPQLGIVKYASLGILKRSDPRHLWQIYNVKRRIPHPEYKSPSMYHDIALLETDKEIKFSDLVLPACVHATDEVWSSSLPTTGWGALGPDKELADTLQAVLVKRYDKSECSKNYLRSRNLKEGFDDTTQMCYGDLEELRDTCVGDSGGPLQYSLPNDYFEELTCIYTIIGVTSSGKKCASAPVPGIYTRVNYYASWIGSVVWP